MHIGSRHRRSWAAVVVALALVPGLVGAAPAAADISDERALAQRFAPVVALVHQDGQCGPGEPYEPSGVDAFLGNDSVALRGPWDRADLVKIGPTASDLGKGLDGYYLDFPGNPLRPGCGYELWARKATAGTEPTIYAHVATEAGRDDRLALQYWFFYPFNDYNNKHEGDWEMIQLLFAAGDPAAALDQKPIQVIYSQHTGAEVARWDDPKLELIDGTHPVVFVASGSHASYYDSALFLGRSSTEGFGCDDTRAPTNQLRPVVDVIPNDPAAARKAFPWITYQGLWGEKQVAFYNGPTGPNTKAAWGAPITFQQQQDRDRTYAVPAGGLLGTGATDFFCSSVAAGSNVVRLMTNNPALWLVILAALVLLTSYLIRKTRWQPSAPLRIARRRSGGQIMAAAARIYRSRWPTFIGIGLLTLPVSLLAAAVQGLIVLAPGPGGPGSGGEAGGYRIAAAAGVGYLLLGFAVVAVLAATTRALAEIDGGHNVTIRQAYRLTRSRWRALVAAFLILSALVGSAGLTILLIPVALVPIVAFSLHLPAAVFEETSAMASLRRSSQLVRHEVTKVAVVLGVCVLVASAVGPVLGTVLILATDAPFLLANVVAGLAFAFLMPFVGLVMAYTYWDARVRVLRAGGRIRAPQTLPAELPAPGASPPT
ncbi:DUF946 domain-containing protein [Kribbella capetownensis]|uniref:DUF946 domain-containing protein n=1 Tax=Kribbella capetownensis TaxID=1572659 RepID=A0A4R0INQ5_9ACTN|nr:Vps62-related protein [Kribbella capetownensis]TCC35281.1 DUF946 domain-containing protein [Kribbella capetownensis]